MTSVAARPQSAVRPTRGGLVVRRRFEGLFPAAVAARITWGRVLAAIVAVVAGTGISLFRTNGEGPFNSIWAEDGTNFLTDALNKSVWDTFTTPINGAYYLLPRLLTEVAKPFGVAWMPAVMSIEAALVTAVLALLVYLASAVHLGSVLPRLVVTLPVVAGAIYGSVPNNVATLQFPMLYAAFWMVLWVPVRRAGQIAALAVLFFTATTTMLSVLLIPLVLLRLYVRRDRSSTLLAVTYLVGVALQVVPHLLGLSPRGNISHPNTDPTWALEKYSTWALPREIWGQVWVQAHHGLLIILAAWAVVLLALAAALVRWTAPNWLLAGVAAAHSVLIFCFAIMSHGSAQLRYVLASGLTLIVALAALLRPRSGRRIFDLTPIVALLALVVVVAGVNLRTDDYRGRALPWDQLIRSATHECETAPPASGWIKFKTTPPQFPWNARIPCRMLVD